MSDLRKSAEQALDALEKRETGHAARILRQALEQSEQEPICAHGVCKTKCDFCKQPEQEPVGYVTDSGKSAYFLKGVDLDDDTPLYTAPPKREWVGLTDEELPDGATYEFGSGACWAAAKLKEKNK